MSQSVDTKVVQLTFDNKDFNKKTSETMQALSELNNKIDNFQESVNQKSDAKAFASMSKNINRIANSFTFLGTLKQSFFRSISSGLIGIGQKITSYIAAPLNQINEGGKNRALTMEQAKFRMEGILKDTEKVSKVINEGILPGVRGTPYSLDQAAAVMSVILTSNQKLANSQEGLNKLADVTRAISGAASMAGTDFQTMGNIFADVASQGFVSGQQLTRLEMQAIPATQLLAQHFGKTTEEIDKMVRKQEISFLEFSDIMNKAYGKHAQEANNTFNGALENAKAALSRIGNEAYAYIFQHLKDILNAVTPIIDDVNSLLSPLFKTLNDLYLSPFASKLVEKLKMVHELITPIEKDLSKLTKQVKDYGKDYKDVFKTVKAVMRGDYGNDSARVSALKKAGYDPKEVQKYVNQVMLGTGSIDGNLKKLEKQLKKNGQAGKDAKDALLDINAIRFPLLDEKKYKEINSEYEKFLSSISNVNKLSKEQKATLKHYEDQLWYLDNIEQRLQVEKDLGESIAKLEKKKNKTKEEKEQLKYLKEQQTFYAKLRTELSLSGAIVEGGMKSSEKWYGRIIATFSSVLNGANNVRKAFLKAFKDIYPAGAPIEKLLDGLAFMIERLGEVITNHLPKGAKELKEWQSSFRGLINLVTILSKLFGFIFNIAATVADFGLTVIEKVVGGFLRAFDGWDFDDTPLKNFAAVIKDIVSTISGKSFENFGNKFAAALQKLPRPIKDALTLILLLAKAIQWLFTDSGKYFKALKERVNKIWEVKWATGEEQPKIFLYFQRIFKDLLSYLDSINPRIANALRSTVDFIRNAIDYIPNLKKRYELLHAYTMREGSESLSKPMTYLSLVLDDLEKKLRKTRIGKLLVDLFPRKDIELMLKRFKSTDLFKGIKTSVDKFVAFVKKKVEELKTLIKSGELKFSDVIKSIKKKIDEIKNIFNFGLNDGKVVNSATKIGENLGNAFGSIDFTKTSSSLDSIKKGSKIAGKSLNILGLTASKTSKEVDSAGKAADSASKSAKKSLTIFDKIGIFVGKVKDKIKIFWEGLKAVIDSGVLQEIVGMIKQGAEAYAMIQGGGALNSLSGVLSRFGKNMEASAKPSLVSKIKDLAIAIGILAGALTVIAYVDSKYHTNLVNAGIILGALLVGLLAFAFGFSQINFEKIGKGALLLAGALFLIGLSILSLSAGVAILVASLAGLVLVIKLYNKLVKSGEFQGGFDALKKVLESLGEFMSSGGVFKGMGFFDSVGLLAVVAALGLLTKVIQAYASLAKLVDEEGNSIFDTGLEKIKAVFEALGELFTDKSKHIASVEVDIFDTTFLLVLAVANFLKKTAKLIEQYAAIDDKKWKAGIGRVTTVMTTLAGFIDAVTLEIGPKLSVGGSFLKDLGITILITSLTIFLYAMTPLIALLGSMNFTQAIIGIGGVAALMLALAFSIRIMVDSADDSAKAVAAIRPLSKFVSSITKLLKYVGILAIASSTANLAISLGGTIVLIGLLAYVVKTLADDENLQDAKKVLPLVKVIGAVLGSITALIAAIGKSFENFSWEQIAASLLGVIGIIGMLGLVFYKLTEVKFDAKNTAQLALLVIAIAGALFILGPAIKQFQGIEWSQLLMAGGVLVVLSVALLALGFAAGKLPGVAVGLTALGVAFAGLGALGVGIYALVLAMEKFRDNSELLPESTRNVANGLKESAPQIKTSIGELVTAMTSGIAERAPDLGKAAGESVTGFIDGISPHIPEISDKGGDMIVGFLGGIQDNIPKVVPEAVNTVETFANEIGAHVQELATAGFELVTNVVSGIGNAIGDPANAQKLKDAAMALGQGLLDFVKNMLGIHSPSTKFMEIGNQCVEGLKLGLKDDGGIKKKAASLMSKLKSGFSGAKDGIKSVVKSVVDKARSAIDNGKEKWRTAATKLGTSISDALGKTKLGTTASTLIKKAHDAISKSSWSDVGTNLGRGLKNGLNSMLDSIKRAARAIIAAAKKSAKAEAEESSPSKAFYRIGAFMTEGLALGMKDKLRIRDVTNSAARMVDSAMAGVSGTNLIDAMFGTLSDPYSIENALTDAIQTAIWSSENMLANTDPVIRPIVDLSNVSKSAYLMSNMFAGQTFSADGSIKLSNDVNRVGNIQNGNRSNDAMLNKLNKTLSAMTDTMNSRSLNNYITVDGATDPNAFADELIRSFRLKARTVQ